MTTSTATVFFVSYPNAGIANQRIEGKTPAEILSIFRSMYNELEKADVKVDGDKVTFVLREGNKASTAVYFVSYPNAGIANQRIEGKTPAEILSIFRSMYNELEKADVKVDGDKVTFVLREGNKAAGGAVYFVSYPNAGIANQRIEGKTPAEILSIFRSMYNELEKADVKVDGDKVTFVLREGNKAAVYFVTYPNAGITNQRIEGKTPAEILAIFRSMYNELEKADVKVDGDKVTFVLREGNKAVHA